MDSQRERITRETATAQLRKALIALTSNGKSVCQVAAERKILCGGFLRYSDDQLRQRYRSIVAQDPTLSRAELEARANVWQLEQQREMGTLVCCDTQWQRYETCRGWDDFPNDALSQFCLELCGQPVEVVGAKTLPGM